MSVLAGALVLGQLAGLAAPAGNPNTFAVTDRSEFRLRSRPEPETGAAADVETTLGAVLVLPGHHRRLLLAYGPRLSYLDFEGDRDLALTHSARAEGAWWTPRLRLTLSLEGSFGSQSAIGLVAPLVAGGDVAAPIQTPNTPVGALPPPAVPTNTPTPTFIPQLLVLQTATFRGGLGAVYTLSRHWSGAAAGYFVLGGGLDYDSQQVLQPYRTPGGELVATYSASRVDQLLSRLRSTYTWTLISRGDFLTIDASESIRHAWSRRTQSTLGAGVSFLRSEEKLGDGHTGAISGTGDASLLSTIPLRDHETLALRGSAQLGTAYNPILAIVQPQLSGVIASTWTRRRLSVILSADAAATLPFSAANASRIASGGVTIAFAVVTPIVLQAGARAYVQLLPPTPGAEGTLPVTVGAATSSAQWVTFVAVLIQPPALEL